jgi:hypothetical protein
VVIAAVSGEFAPTLAAQFKDLRPNPLLARFKSSNGGGLTDLIICVQPAIYMLINEKALSIWGQISILNNKIGLITRIASP